MRKVIAYQANAFDIQPDEIVDGHLLLVYHNAQKSEILDLPPKPCYERYNVIKIQPTYAVRYSLPLEAHHTPKLLPKLNKANGKVSLKAASRIRNAVNWMLYFTKKKWVYSKKENIQFSFLLNFITLTLPSDQRHTDDYIKTKMLIPFIQMLTKTEGATMYLWKAESQNNGNIHFHLTTHVFIHWRTIRRKWNIICAKHGYCKVYQDGSNDKGDSATQIKAAKNPEQVGGYLAKYIGKNDLLKVNIKKPKGLPSAVKTICFSDSASNYCYGSTSVLKRPINGRLWACSENLSNINVYLSEADCEVSNLLYTECATSLLESSDRVMEEEYYEVLLYRHLKFSNILPSISKLIKKSTPQIDERTIYRVDSLLSTK